MLSISRVMLSWCGLSQKPYRLTGGARRILDQAKPMAGFISTECEVRL
jgi:hypothetical protein